jgi:hypothetical protein
MYAKLFASLYQGTLRGKPNEILVFTNMLAHADREGYVDKHFRAIADEVGISAEDVRAAVGVLESPDNESRSPELEGRRITRVNDHRAWGWKIVNYRKYREIRNDEDRREQNRAAQERWREKQKASVSQRKPRVSRESKKNGDSKHGKPMEKEKEMEMDKQMEMDKEIIPASPAAENNDGTTHRKPPTGPHHEFIRLWSEGYSVRFRCDYKFQEGKDGAAVKALLNDGAETPESLMATVRKAWANPTGFHCKRATSIPGFRSAFNDIRGELANANGNHAPDPTSELGF